MANIYDNAKNLPHYTSRKEAGIGKEEPIYSNNFVVTIIPPTGVGNSDLLNAHIQKIEGMSTNPGTEAVTQNYKGATRSYASGLLENSTNDLTLGFTANLNESNQFYIYKILKAWKNRIHDPETGRRGLKKNYTGQIIVEQFNREGDVFRRVTYYDCFITSALPEVGGDYSSGDLIPLDGIVFRSDAWKEELV